MVKLMKVELGSNALNAIEGCYVISVK